MDCTARISFTTPQNVLNNNKLKIAFGNTALTEYMVILRVNNILLNR
jgi:hypothetical protein